MYALSLIGVDWGTSSLRCVAFDGHGEVLDRVDSAQGILAVPDAQFEAVLTERIGHWQRARAVPVILSGMITSRNGWIETPYLPAPCSPHDLARSLVPASGSNGWPLAFVPGVSQTPQAGLAHRQHDVMRGEETEILGHLASTGEADGWFVLPGTHSKWVRVHDGAIHGFTTFMTGEVFSALSAHTILGRLMDMTAPMDTAAFEAGVLSQTTPTQSLLGRLFAVRAMPLLEAMPAAHTRDYLAGLLIGTECSDGLAQGAYDPVIIGRPDLVERYQRALAVLGCQARAAQPGNAARGQWEIARRSGTQPFDKVGKS